MFSQADIVRAMYDNTSLFTGQPYKPGCSDFASNVSTSHFTWNELSINLQHYYGGYLIGVFSTALLGVNGIDAVRTTWGGPLTLTSTYRDPQHNHDIGSTAPQSQHMYGTATDISTPGASWQAGQ